MWVCLVDDSGVCVVCMDSVMCGCVVDSDVGVVCMDSVMYGCVWLMMVVWVYRLGVCVGG